MVAETIDMKNKVGKRRQKLQARVGKVVLYKRKVKSSIPAVLLKQSLGE